jgi:hypothetical protein
MCDVNNILILQLFSFCLITIVYHLSVILKSVPRNNPYTDHDTDAYMRDTHRHNIIILCLW